MKKVVIILKILFIKPKDPGAFWLLLGIPVIIILGSLFHFIYEWSGNNVFVGLISPINESVWEHLKLTFYPTILWGILGYIIFKDTLSLPNYVYSWAISLIIGPIIILTLFYTYTGILGTHSLILDIAIFMIAVIISQLLALYIYSHSDITQNYLLLPILIVLLLFIAFTVFTFDPPNLPLFIEA
jgi:hypothetical protein